MKPYIHTLQHYDSFAQRHGDPPLPLFPPLLSVHEEDSIYEQREHQDLLSKRKAKQSLLLLSKKGSVYEVDNMDLFLFS